MRNKTILLIDEDEVVLSLLQKSLIGHNPNHQIFIESTAESALNHMDGQYYDMVIADLPLVTSRETHLLDALRERKAAGTAIAVTAYNYQRIMQVNIGDLTNVHLIPKPIKTNDLKQVVERTLGKPSEAMLEKPAGADELYQKVGVAMESLRTCLHGRCILLSDAFGNIIYRVGNLGELPLEAMTSLLCGGVATLVEAGKSMDEQDVINLAYREGKSSDLYALNLGSQWVLIIVVDRGQYYERLGSVWYHARKTAVELRAMLEKSNPAKTVVKFAGAIDQAYSDELDKLFG